MEGPEMVKFGKLEAVPIREGWPREDSEFTPWLAAEENLSSLAQEIGMELELVETESAVGTFRTDILARRSGSDETVVIENQFGKTDHSHLGQLLTYAAGVGTEGGGAKMVVWIAERFTEPHQAALDWLNQCTEPGIRFFGLELQLWRMGGSAFAPKFDLVCRPNNWQKKLTQKTAAAVSESGLFYQEFWTAFIEVCGKNTFLRLPQPPPRHWLATSIGKSGFGVNLTASVRRRRMESQLWIDGNRAKAAFAKLLAQREAIVSVLGSEVIFDEMPGRGPCKIYEIMAGNVSDRSQWPVIHRWLKERGEAYARVFTPLVGELEAE
jgi:hypothetical protein